MQTDQFWTIVESAARKGRGDQDDMLEALSTALKALPPEEVASFQQRMDELMARAYTWDLWGAAYIMNGGCSDDGFEYFCAWLLAQGRAVYEAALQDPESLAKAKLSYGEPGEFDFESLLYTPAEVYEELTGNEIPRNPAAAARPGEPRGERWEEDQLDERFPTLARKFND